MLRVWYLRGANRAALGSKRKAVQSDACDSRAVKAD